MSNRQCQGVLPRYSMKDFYSNKSTINHHLCTRTTFEEVSQNEGPAKNPLNWLICVEILSGFRNASVSTHPWKPLYRMEIVPGCPRHIMPRCKTCATHKTYFYTIKLDRLLILTKTFNGQEARSSILYQLPPNSLWSPKMVKFSMLPFPSKKEKICSSYPQHFPYANTPSLHPKSPHRRARLSTVRGSSFCSVRGVGTSLWWKGHQMKAS